MKCNHCGKEIHDNSSYCPHCGNKLNKPEALFCPKCHKMRSSDMAFCPTCGSKLSDNRLEGTPPSANTTKSISKSCAAQEEPKYDVMIVSARNKTVLIRAIQREKQIDKKSAKDIVEHLPFVIWSNVTEKDAKGSLPILRQLGIEGEIVPSATDSVSETPLQKHTATSSAQYKNSSAYDKDDQKRERKKKIRTIFNLMSASLFFLASVFIFVLPLYSTSKGTTNLLMQMIDLIKSVIVNLTDIKYLSFLWIILRSAALIALIGSIYHNVKLLIGNIKELIKHARAPYHATIAQTSQLSYLLFVIVAFGIGNLLWDTVILVGVFDILGIIACRVAKRIKY